VAKSTGLNTRERVRAVSNPHIDVSRIRADGFHSLKVGSTLFQVVLSGPEAIRLAQHIAPVRGAEKISIVPVVVAEKKDSRR
jgi:hypothetical protein